MNNKQKGPRANSQIWHEIIINASPGDLYQALTDVKKLAHWWTTDTWGKSETGKNMEFCFEAFCQEMQVTNLKANQLVRWQATEKGLPDCAGTEIEFKIFREENQTFLHLRHSGWRDNAKMFPHCSMGWAVFLLSLKEFVETGKGRPYPYDWPGNNWRPPQ